MSETKTYTGGCHCGEVRFEVTTDLGSVIACNCSLCQKRGALWSFVPSGQFGLRAGAEDLKDYQFGKKIGLTEAQIAAAQGDTYMASPDLDERQKAAVRWAEAVTTMTARDDNEAFAEMKKHFSEKQIVELTVFCGMWNYSNRLCEALHVDLERPDKRIEFQQK